MWRESSIAVFGFHQRKEQRLQLGQFSFFENGCLEESEFIKLAQNCLVVGSDEDIAQIKNDRFYRSKGGNFFGTCDVTVSEFFSNMADSSNESFGCHGGG